MSSTMLPNAQQTTMYVNILYGFTFLFLENGLSVMYEVYCLMHYNNEHSVGWISAMIVI